MADIIHCHTVFLVSQWVPVWHCDYNGAGTVLILHLIVGCV